MKKIVKVLITILLLLLSFSNLYSINIAKANEVTFENFNFTSTKTRENGKIKVKIILEWETITDIAITSITTEINGQTQSTSKIEADSESYEIIDENGVKEVRYKYSLAYNVEHWQIGTMTLGIGYINVENGNSYVAEYCIPGGKWIDEEVSWSVAFSFGIFVTFCIGLGTYIIIENSKKGYLNSDTEE